LPEEGQVALILKTLCGFSTAEISHAFLTNEETITKRLYRAKEQFRNEAIAFALPSPSELQTRLENVLTAIYLIFNEGYHTAHHTSIIREELIEGSLRLGKMLVDNEITNLPITNALMALLCFNTSRVYGRLDENGNLLQLKNQNRSKWNKQLIVQGNHYLNRAASIEPPTPYHIEAAIAYEHCQAATFAETNWQRIVELYDWLYQLKPMPLIQLNQLIALAEWKGAGVALAKINDLQLMEQLPNNVLLHAALGEWRLSIGEKESAKGHFEKAVGLSKTEKEKLFFTNRLRECY
jgi:RNA polymerase sigma-70 factor (ECF subfamily)